MEIRDFAIQDTDFDPQKWTKVFLDAYKTDNDIPFTSEFQELANTPGKDGNINHFVNVIFAMRHLMDYAEKNLGFAIDHHRRIFNIVAAFYHDLGKTKVFHRHALMGSIMLESMDRRTDTEFSTLPAADYRKIIEADLPLLAVIVRFHDVFGMCSTGEASSASLQRAVNSLCEVTGGDAELSNAINDLWLLNVSDVIVSDSDKFKLGHYTTSNLGSLDLTFANFFNTFKGKNMLSDLQIAKDIAFNGLDGVKKAEEQAAYRIQCLMWETFSEKWTSKTADIMLKAIESDKTVIDIRSALKREFGEDYNHAFGTFLQFDYSLGVFLKITEAVIKGQEVFNTWYTVVIKIFKKLYEIKGDLAWNVEFEDVGKLTEKDINSLLGKNGIYEAEKTLDNLMKQIFLYK
jgi:hypothetical protein